MLPTPQVFPSSSVCSPVAGEPRRCAPTTTDLLKLLADLGDATATAQPLTDRDRLVFKLLGAAPVSDEQAVALGAKQVHADAARRYCARLLSQLRRMPRQRERTSRAQRAAPRARSSHRKPAGTAARAPASSDGDSDPEPPRRRPLGGGVQRVGVLTIDPSGADRFVVIKVDPATTTPDEWIAIARRAVGWDAEVAEIRAEDLGLHWQTISPGATRGGVA